MRPVTERQQRRQAETQIQKAKHYASKLSRLSLPDIKAATGVMEASKQSVKERLLDSPSFFARTGNIALRGRALCLARRPQWHG